MYCPLVMGLSILAFAFYQWVKAEQLLRRGQRVTAEVIGYLGQGNKNDRTVRPKNTYGLIVRYRPPDEEPVELAVSTGGKGARFKPGQQLQVVYDPAKPDEWAIIAGEDVWLGPVLLLVFGLIVTILGLQAV